MNNYKNLYKYFFIFLGFFMIISYLWFRFIRKRLPKEIPFNLSFYGMLVLLFIIFIYSYIIYKYITNNTDDKRADTSIGTQIYDFLLFPLKEMDRYFKSLYIYKYLLVLLIKIYKIFINKEKLFVIIFTIMPRIILSSVLFIDTFYYHYLSNFYKVVLLGILILIEKYIKFSITSYKDDLIVTEDKFITIDMPYEYAIEIVEDTPPEDPDEEDFIPDNLGVYPLSKFIEYQTKIYISKGKYYPYNILSSSAGYERFRAFININDNADIPIDKRKVLREKNNHSVKELLNLALFVEKLSLVEIDKTIKNIKILIFTIYLDSWLYILITSLPNLYLDYFFYKLIEISLENPFI